MSNEGESDEYEAEEEGGNEEIVLDEGELVIRSEADYEEERKHEKLALMERLRRVREPHLRRKMVLGEPCIPWEYGSNKHDSQKGTGGFGRIRDTTLKIHASKNLAKGDPWSVPRWSQVGGFANQSGQTPFGAIREQVTRVVEHEGEPKKRCQELLINPKETERVLKLWAKPNPEAKNQKLFGSKRQVVGMSVGGREWTRQEAALSAAALPRLCRVDETSAARDGREAVMGMATGFVARRQVIMRVSGLERTAQDQLESNKCQSWLGGQARGRPPSPSPLPSPLHQLLLQTQSRMGGFQKPRDVVNTSYYARLMADSGLLKKWKNSEIEAGGDGEEKEETSEKR